MKVIPARSLSGDDLDKRIAFTDAGSTYSVVIETLEHEGEYVYINTGDEDAALILPREQSVTVGVLGSRPRRMTTVETRTGEYVEEDRDV